MSVNNEWKFKFPPAPRFLYWPPGGRTSWAREREALTAPVQRGSFIHAVEAFLMTVWTFSVTKTKSNLQDAPEAGCTVRFAKLG